MESTRKVGRPKVPAAELKRSRCIRVSDVTWNDWNDRAKRLGKTVSDVIEPAMQRELKRMERNQ